MRDALGFFTYGRSDDFIANDISSGVFYSDLVSGFKIGERNLQIPVIPLFPRAVLVSLAEEDQTPAGHTVHERGFAFGIQVHQRPLGLPLCIARIVAERYGGERRNFTCEIAHPERGLWKPDARGDGFARNTHRIS